MPQFTTTPSGNNPKSKPRQNPSRVLPARYAQSLLFLVLWVFLLLIGRSAMLHDPGSFWHVATGDRMLSTWHTPRDDPYSFTFAGRPWVDNQWLAECGMAAVHRLAGFDGLVLVSATLLATLYTWIAMRLLRAGLHPLPAASFLAVILLIGSPQFLARPLILTMALLALTFASLVDVEAGKKPIRQLWWLAPLFIVWTNLHGGVLAGIGTVGLCAGGWIVADIMRSFRASCLTSERSRVPCLLSDRSETASMPEVEPSPQQPCPWRLLELSLLVLALLATTLINPYGVDLPREWWQTLTMPLPSLISEHVPLDLTEPVGVATIGLAILYLVVLLSVLPNRLRVVWLLPLVWFVLALQRVRNAPLFSITAAIALADMLPYSRVGSWLARREMLGQPAALRCGWCCMVLPLVVAAAGLATEATGVRLPLVGRGWAQLDPAYWPVEMLPKLDELNNEVEDGAPIFNDLNFGGFLIYYAPRLRVFIDDRCTVYGGDFLTAYDRARRENPGEIDRWQQQYGFQYALVATGKQFDRYLADNRQWKRVANTPAATLYQRRMGVFETVR